MRELAFDGMPVAGGHAEAVLLERCRAGDEGAFAQLVRQHESMAWSLAARLLGDPDEARDVCQDVFLKLYRTLDRFEGRCSLRTWIYRIVVNACRNRRRWWCRRRRHVEARALEDLAPPERARLTHAPGDDPHQAAVRRERAASVRSALLAVSFEHRTVLLLREVEGLTCEEIGHTLGLPVGTVKSRLSRARDALREAVLRQGEGR